MSGNDSINDNTSSAETRSNSSGNQLHVHGLTTGQGLVIAGIASLSLGLSGMTIVIMLTRDGDRHAAEDKRQAETLEQMRKTETETRVMYGRQLEYKATLDSMNNRLMQVEADHVKR